MFEDIRQAVQAAPRDRLPVLATLLWRAFGEGRVTEAEAGTLSGLIEARRVEGAPQIGTSGSRTAAVQLGRLRSIFPPRRLQRAPDRSASIERRRRLACSGPMPPPLAARFTTGQLAALRIVADEVAQHGACTLPIDAIAARAGVSRRLAQTAIRLAESDGLILVQERRQRGDRSLPNRITVLSREWWAWIARSGRGGGCRKSHPTDMGVQDLSETKPGSGPRKRAAGSNPPTRRRSRAAGA